MEVSHDLCFAQFSSGQGLCDLSQSSSKCWVYVSTSSYAGTAVSGEEQQTTKNRIVSHPGSFPPAKLPFCIIPLSYLHINIENIVIEWLFLLSLLFLTHLYWSESQINQSPGWEVIFYFIFSVSLTHQIQSLCRMDISNFCILAKILPRIQKINLSSQQIKLHAKCINCFTFLLQKCKGLVCCFLKFAYLCVYVLI